MSSTFDKDVYFVAVKILIRDGDKLLIVHDVFDTWELPGGRIKKDELTIPIENIIERKVREELGQYVKYRLGEPKAFFRLERPEADLEKVRIFAIGFEADYLGGEIILGECHDKFEWVDVKTFDPLARQDNGWMRGVKEYLEKIK